MRSLFLIAFLATLIFLQINGEKIPVNEGAFGDGVFYRSVGQTFLESIEAQGYNLVQLTRMLPFAVLNLSFSTFHIVKDFEGMRNGMIIWQVIYLALAIYWYFKICKKLRLKTPILTLGFILLFFNFTWLKEFWYHPFSPDGLAFALGMGQTNYFLRYEKFKLGLVSLLGIFVSPLLLISGLLMLFLPGDKLIPYSDKRPPSAFPVMLAFAIAVFLAVFGWGIWGWGAKPWLDQVLYVLSIVAIFPLIIGMAKRNPIDWEASIILFRKKTKPDRLSKGIMVFAAILLVLVLLSGKNETLGIGQLIRERGSGTFRFPLDFILGLGLQWGLAIVLTGIYLPRFADELGNLGWAAVISLGLGMVLLPYFGALSMAAWTPLWIIILIKGIKRYHWGNKDLLLMGAFALLFSLAWLPLNSSELATWLAMPNAETAHSLSIQKFAIHWEDYRNWTAYLIALTAFALVTYFLLLRRKRYQRVLTG
ncbi:hypothetical protein [Algoriphagus boritolerans]|uniref:Uncharacterized protein n=1 Tax=Algoriphagus boritolerans DSM 17298 = JCM 18970 TaxID=1120964 RepID=A0A1H6A5K4_9BACT|nr:hypothetical protein [Algoriphagus boritolerans]SEG43652.1 hypothetical protein SAMN03080598_03918 [Algoriphagus boritolerans DSM 17298 = JCM 18970]